MKRHRQTFSKMRCTSYQFAASSSHQLWLSKNLLHQWVQPGKGALATPPDKPGGTPYGDFPGFDWFWAKVLGIPPQARLEWVPPHTRWTHGQSVGKVCSKWETAKYTEFSKLFSWLMCLHLISRVLDDSSSGEKTPNAAKAKLQIPHLALGVGGPGWERERVLRSEIQGVTLRPSTAQESFVSHSWSKHWIL